MANRLAAEKSPYLLQHAENPVDWRPWGEEAFGEARRESKPIFLSIGYSTCHWCHVMAHESFENAEIAALINRDFIPIKVDREERPDVDRVYMTFVQATTGSGGWPMSVWLTPELEPFYGGTYFPPQSRWNMPGFADVLQSIAHAWANDRLRVVQSAQSLVNEVRRLGAGRLSASGGTIAGPEQLAVAVRQFASAFDARRGGFGDAPKFPRPSELLFLLREHARTGEAAPRDMVLQTLRAMALGGMRDHVGGGFHRYSVDGNWRVPHFEKMLYDQAQLVLAYLEAAQASGDPFFAEIAEDTLRYVARELQSPDGGFYSAEDADSVPPGQADAAAPHSVEGAFYTWSAEELHELLNGDFDAFALRFGIEEAGNAPFDPHGEFTGLNLLYTARSLEDVATKTDRSVDAVAEALSRARVLLYTARVGRPRPHLDDKILSAWNGLMIAAYARASRVLRAERFGLTECANRHLETALRAATFVREHLWRAADRRLLRRYRDGEAAFDGYAEDYASMAFGLLELFQATGEVEWLDWAETLQRCLDERFWDAESGGWFSTTGADPSVLVRLKEDYDGAEPSVGALASLNLLTLSNLLPDDGRMEKLERALSRFGERLGDAARVVPLVAAAASAWTAGVGQVVVSSSATDDASALVSTLAARYLPFMVVVPVADASRSELGARLPFLASLPARDGAATAYVCRNFVCQAPATSVAALETALAAR
jgi:uncharacterized protein YyaL (SSP411 family)